MALPKVAQLQHLKVHMPGNIRHTLKIVPTYSLTFWSPKQGRIKLAIQPLPSQDPKAMRLFFPIIVVIL